MNLIRDKDYVLANIECVIDHDSKKLIYSVYQKKTCVQVHVNDGFKLALSKIIWISCGLIIALRSTLTIS